MSNNIDTIRSSVSETKNKIHEYENLSPEERMARARELETTISQIRKDLDSLKEDANQTNTQEIEQLEQEFNELQEQFNSKFKQELEDLQQDISENSNWSAVDTDDSEIIPSENDKPTWRERNKKTVLLWAWTLWVWLLIRRWWKKRKERKEAEAWWSTSSETKEKKPWYKRWRWVGLIWVAWFFGAKWLLNYFKKSPDPLDSPEEQLDSYLKLKESNEKDYEQYEQLWGTINAFYEQAWNVEKEHFWFETDLELWAIWDSIKDKEKYGNIEAKGLVPYCLDNYYTNVDDLLSAGGVRKYLRNKKIEWYKQTIKALWAEWFSKTLVPYLAIFANFGTFGILSTDSSEQKMKKFFDWINEDSIETKKQLDIFFRQYTKVLTYMADKKNALAMKHAMPIIQSQGYDWESWPSDPKEQQELLLEAVNDKKRVNTHLKWTQYDLFLNSKILWASKILKDEWLLNSEITPELQEIVENLDQDAENILGWFESNALFDAEVAVNEWKTVDQNTKEWLSDICDNLIKDLWGEEEWSWRYDTFEYVFIALDLEDKDKETIMEESWMKDWFESIRTNIKNLQAEVAANPTKENIETLKKLTWEYLAMKKELHLAVYAMQEAKENKDFIDHALDVLKWIWTFFGKFFESIWNIFSLDLSAWTLINFFVWSYVSWQILVFIWRVSGKKILIKPWRLMTNIWASPWTLARAGLSRTGVFNGMVMRKRIIRLALDGDKDQATRVLYRGIAEGKISMRQAVKAAKHKGMYPNAYVHAGIEDNFKLLLKNILPTDTPTEDIDLFVKYYNKNRKISRQLLNESTSRALKSEGRLQNVEFNKSMFEELKNVDKSLEKITDNAAKTYFDNMLKKVKNMDDLKLMDELVKDSDFVKKITPGDLKKLNKLSLNEIRTLKASWDFDSFKQSNKSLNDILVWLGKNKNVVKQTAEAVNNIDVNIQKQFNNIIDEAIDSAKWTAGLSDNFSQTRIQKLSDLKAKSLSNADMEALISLHQKGIKAQYLPDISSRVKVDLNLEKALMEWDFDEFSRVARANKSLKNVDNIIWEFDTVLKRTWRYADDFADIAKNILKVVSKIA